MSRRCVLNGLSKCFSVVQCLRPTFRILSNRLFVMFGPIIKCGVRCRSTVSTIVLVMVVRLVFRIPFVLPRLFSYKRYPVRYRLFLLRVRMVSKVLVPQCLEVLCNGVVLPFLRPGVAVINRLSRLVNGKCNGKL